MSLGMAAASLWFYWSHLETISVVGRPDFVALSPDWEAWIGLQILEAMLLQVGLVHISDPTDRRLQLVQAVLKERDSQRPRRLALVVRAGRRPARQCGLLSWESSCGCTPVFSI